MLRLRDEIRAHVAEHLLWLALRILPDAVPSKTTLRVALVKHLNSELNRLSRP
jgi:hypothetical protein